MLVSGKIISVETLKNPIVCIANYVFNSLSHDAYRVQTDGFYVAECTISSSAKTFTNIKVEKVEPKPHELIQWMSVDWAHQSLFFPRKSAVYCAGTMSKNEATQNGNLLEYAPGLRPRPITPGSVW